MGEEEESVEKSGKGEEAKKKPALAKTVKVSLGLLGGLSLLMGYISAAGMKESDREFEARRAVDDFFAALNARDIEAARKTLHYPHIQIAGNDVIVWTDPETFQIDFPLMASEGWTHSTLDSCVMRQNCDEKVHFEVQLSMHKAGVSRYATYQALWIVTRQNDRWGIQCRSIFPNSAKI
jgi:hypothetical protein